MIAGSGFLRSHQSSEPGWLYQRSISAKGARSIAIVSGSGQEFSDLLSIRTGIGTSR